MKDIKSMSNQELDKARRVNMWCCCMECFGCLCNIELGKRNESVETERDARKREFLEDMVLHKIT